jgi:hypothetical protein
LPSFSPSPLGTAASLALRLNLNLLLFPQVRPSHSRFLVRCCRGRRNRSAVPFDDANFADGDEGGRDGDDPEDEVDDDLCRRRGSAKGEWSRGEKGVRRGKVKNLGRKIWERVKGERVKGDTTYREEERELGSVDTEEGDGAERGNSTEEEW